jgi:hypothetical protein
MFWDEVDRRCLLYREIKSRYEQLKQDTGADSYQKDLILQRAVFLSLQLQTMEIQVTEGGDFDSGGYSNLTNVLVGLLKALGLEKALPKMADLQSYVAKKGSNHD